MRMASSHSTAQILGAAVDAGITQRGDNYTVMMRSVMQLSAVAFKGFKLGLQYMYMHVVRRAYQSKLHHHDSLHVLHVKSLRRARMTTFDLKDFKHRR